ncbi:MAG: UDP-N-acetylmuramate dehydrogenase, partial [Candidatus Babeliales bacterium]|nr:UDP-N-acetylmuramate dehydrogenase [Candidatus Babeliales bacterium]
VPLADKNWFKTGGLAKYYVEPKTATQFAQALKWAQEQHLELFVLGQGANILISDDGFDGLVIRPQLIDTDITPIDDVHVAVTAGSGKTIHDLILYCLEHNISGLEEFAGIPGTVGGSVYINLHYYQFLLDQFLISAQIIDKRSGEISTATPDWFQFGYNQSTLLEQNHYLVSATFKLKKINDLEVAYAKGRRIEIIRHREKRYPSTHTCGSFFRNFHQDEVTLMSNGKKMIHVAYYLDKIGVKGQLSVGGAIVSYQHANMLVNKGEANSTDIIMLARQMQEMVKDAFGIIPQPECQLIGFKQNPLL